MDPPLPLAYQVGVPLGYLNVVDQGQYIADKLGLMADLSDGHSGSVGPQHPIAQLALAVHSDQPPFDLITNLNAFKRLVVIF